MMNRTTIAGAFAALALAGAIAGQGVASRSGEAAATAKAASSDARRATKALERREAAIAIRFAEQAVALAPRSADYRMLLGQGYLQGGRFASAAAAFADVLALDDTNGRAALNLALAQVATGDWQSARRTLETYSGRIPATDLGLALALAGDPAGAVRLLTDAARTPGAGAKVRQNLALAMALAGQWQSARVVAATDMSPADVDQRLQQWAAFAQPRAASDQVASLLGVQAVQDPGQPVALALNAPVPVTPAVALAAAAPEAAAVPATIATEAAPPPMLAAIVFGPRREVVQSLPVPLIQAEGAPARIALARIDRARAVMTARVQPMRVLRSPSLPIPADMPFRRLGAPTLIAAAAPGRGTWFVQLGAYRDVAVARDAWGRFNRRNALFGGRVANGAMIKAGGSQLFRLSVGGLARADADALCRRHRANGGACFVRAGAGDQIVRWGGRTNVQLAMR